MVAFVACDYCHKEENMESKNNYWNPPGGWIQRAYHNEDPYIFDFCCHECLALYKKEKKLSK